jgi:hypothetical protein
VKGHVLWRKGGRIGLELLPKPKGGRGAIFPASNIDLSFRSRGGITFRVWPLCVTNLGFLTPSLFSDATRSPCLSDKQEGEAAVRGKWDECQADLICLWLGPGRHTKASVLAHERSVSLKPSGTDSFAVENEVFAHMERDENLVERKSKQESRSKEMLGTTAIWSIKPEDRICPVA